MDARWAGAVGEEGRAVEQQRGEGRNPVRLQQFGSSAVEAAVPGGEELPALGLRTHAGPTQAGGSWVSALPK